MCGGSFWLFNSLSFAIFHPLVFGLYSLHGALAAYFLSGPLFVFGKGDVSTFLIMLLMPWANLAFCLAAAHAVQRFAPRIYALLTGGRGFLSKLVRANSG